MKLRRNLSNRSRSYRRVGDYGRSAFVFTRAGRISFATGPVQSSAPLVLAQDLHDGLAASFGHGVARVVCNAICFPPYSMPPLYAVGTRQRLALLWSIIDRLGEFRDGVGFGPFGAFDDHDFEVVYSDDFGFCATDIPPVVASGGHSMPPVESLHLAADLPPHCVLANDAVAVSLPPSGGYSMYLRGLDGWGLVHCDMPAIILKGKAGAVYPDLFKGLCPLVNALPEPEALGPSERLSFIRSFIGGRDD